MLLKLLRDTMDQLAEMTAFAEQLRPKLPAIAGALDEMINTFAGQCIDLLDVAHGN